MPFQLKDAVAALSQAGSSGLGTDTSLQLETQLKDRQRKQLQGHGSNPDQYGDRLISSNVLGLFGSMR